MTESYGGAGNESKLGPHGATRHFEIAFGRLVIAQGSVVFPLRDAGAACTACRRECAGRDVGVEVISDGVHAVDHAAGDGCLVGGCSDSSFTTAVTLIATRAPAAIAAIPRVTRIMRPLLRLL